MVRSAVSVREAVPGDAGVLAGLMAPGAARPADTEAAIASLAADPDARLLVAVLEERVVGAVHLVRGTVSPLQCDSAVHVRHLHVAEDSRRRGVGRALMEAAVSWAEEKDTGYLLATAPVGSRDANRFMARLGLGQVAVLRAAPVASVRARLPVEAPAAALAGGRVHRGVGQVLARRRRQRRTQAAAEGGAD